MKIRTKIFLSIITFIIITGCTIILIGNTVLKDIIKNQIYNQLESTAKSRVNHIETYLNTEKTFAKGFAESIAIKKLLELNNKNKGYYDRLKDVLTLFKNSTQINGEIYDIFILDLKGKIIASNIKERIGLNRSDDLYFINGKKGVYIKSPYYSNFFENQPLLAISTPIFHDINNTLLGVVVICIKLNYLNKITTDATGLGESGEIYLVNKDGYMITSSRFINDVFLKQKVKTSAPIECWDMFGKEEEIKRKQVNTYENYIGEIVIGIHYRIEEVNWCCLAEISKKEAFAPVLHLTYIILFILGVIIIVSMIVSVLISKTIKRPILKLHHGIEEIENGNLDYKVGTKAKDEIGQLSRGFDKMTGELKTSKEKLKKHSQELEQKVKARSKELNAKIKESEHQRIATLNILQEVDEVNKNLKKEISERVKTEKALQESEEKYRLLADNTLDCIWKTDKDMRFTYVNPAIFTMLGFTPKEWTGSSLAEHCSENEFKKVKNIIAKEMRKDDTYSATFEITLVHKDGKDIPVEISGNILIDENKNIIEIQGTTRDITERKIAAKELEQRLGELEIYYKATLGREGRIIELKQEINRLLERLGEKSKFGV